MPVPQDVESCDTVGVFVTSCCRRRPICVFDAGFRRFSRTCLLLGARQPAAAAARRRIVLGSSCYFGLRLEACLLKHYALQNRLMILGLVSSPLIYPLLLFLLLWIRWSQWFLLLPSYSSYISLALLANLPTAIALRFSYLWRNC